MKIITGLFCTVLKNCSYVFTQTDDIFFNLKNDDSTDCVWTKNEKNMQELLNSGK